MLEGITVALQSYYDTATSAKNILESALVQIRENYIGATLAEKTKEIQTVYNDTLKESREKNFNACVEILDGIDAKVQEIVKVPVPADFTATLEALKQIKEPSKVEVETVVDAYRNNYYAYRAICDYLKIKTKPVTIDDIQEDLSDIRSNLHKCFFSDGIDGYHFLNWKDGSTTIIPYDAVITAFCDSRFEDASVSNLDS